MISILKTNNKYCLCAPSTSQWWHINWKLFCGLRFIWLYLHQIFVLLSTSGGVSRISLLSGNEQETSKPDIYFKLSVWLFLINFPVTKRKSEKDRRYKILYIIGSISHSDISGLNLSKCILRIKTLILKQRAIKISLMKAPTSNSGKEISFPYC